MSSATVTSTLVYLFIYLFVFFAHNGDSYTRSVGSAVSDFGVTEPENYTKYNEEQIQLCYDFSFFLSFFLSLCYVDSEYMYAGCAVLGFGVSVVRKKKCGDGGEGISALF